MDEIDHKGGEGDMAVTGSGVWTRWIREAASASGGVGEVYDETRASAPPLKSG